MLPDTQRDLYSGIKPTTIACSIPDPSNTKLPVQWDKVQGPVVQSVVSLTSSLRVISLTVLADSIYTMYNILIFFQQKISAYLRITRCKF